jgi:hypothetical protein
MKKKIKKIKLYDKNLFLTTESRNIRRSNFKVHGNPNMPKVFSDLRILFKWFIKKYEKY